MRGSDPLLFRGLDSLIKFLSSTLKFRNTSRSLLFTVAVMSFFGLPLIFFCVIQNPTEAKTIEATIQNQSGFPKGETFNIEIDPLDRLGKGIRSNASDRKISQESAISEAEKEAEKGSEKYLNYYILAGYPIEQMIPFIDQQNENIAALLIAIAKKESDWGRHSPSMAGQDCFNYWGLKGKGRTIGSGYRCFDSPDQAVSEVSERLSKLVEQGLDTPSKLLVWKCGASCAKHDPRDVQRWISDINNYLQQIKS